MFFRRRKKGPEAPSTERRRTASSIALTGDVGHDQRSVDLLLEEIARVSERVARVSRREDLEELLTYIVDASIERTDAERGLLVLMGEDGALRPEVARSRRRKDLEPNAVFPTSIVRRALETGRPLRDTFDSEMRSVGKSSSIDLLELRASMCVPLIASGQGGGGAGQRGVLYVDSTAERREFTEQDLSFFTTLGHHISLALESARLHVDSLVKLELEQSLELASAIQRTFMTRIPGDVQGYELHGWYRSADRTSGDFYSFVRTEAGALGVLIGDAAGHGIGPALVTAQVQGGLRSLLEVVDDPAEALTILNRDLAGRTEEGMFLTLCLVLLEQDGGMRVLNAGHPPPLVWRRETGEVLEVVVPRQVALGIVHDHVFQSVDAQRLEPGDVLVVYTDGLVEARQQAAPGELLGLDGLQAILARCAPDARDVRAIAETLAEETLRITGGNRDDDMTLVAVRRGSRD